MASGWRLASSKSGGRYCPRVREGRDVGLGWLLRVYGCNRSVLGLSLWVDMMPGGLLAPASVRPVPYKHSSTVALIALYVRVVWFRGVHDFHETTSSALCLPATQGGAGESELSASLLSRRASAHPRLLRSNESLAQHLCSPQEMRNGAGRVTECKLVLVRMRQPLRALFQIHPFHF